MMPEKKIDFSSVQWEEVSPFLRAKVFEQGGKKIRLLEIKRGFNDPEWCETGHIGYVIEGELDIDFSGEVIKFSTGDILFIAAGQEQKHIPIPISERVLLLLVEEI